MTQQHAHTIILKLLFCKNFTGHAAGGVVVQALSYKPEGRGVDSRWGHWNF
jgi:hypothetical protein